MNQLTLTSPQPPKRWLQARRTYKGKPHVSEKAVQAAILRYLQICPYVAWSYRQNSGKFKVQDKHGTRWVEAGFTGCPDIMGMLKDGRFLGVECKSSSGRASQEQKNFGELVQQHGGVFIIARSVDDVVEGLRKALKL